MKFKLYWNKAFKKPFFVGTCIRIQMRSLHTEASFQNLDRSTY
jgi:hypothetical protein